MMQIKQTLAVIGATGHTGYLIAKSLAKGPYRLLLKADKLPGPEDLVKEIRNLHRGAEVEAATCSTDACWEADIILLVPPFDSVTEINEKIRDVANQKIVINLSGNRNDENIAPGYQTTKTLQEFLPHSKLVTVYGPAFDETPGGPVKQGKRKVAFVSGNDEDAVKTVSDMMNIAGFDIVVGQD